jgi:hypothetical protein
MTIEYTAYLQGSLVLDSDGFWWHEGIKFKNEKLATFFHQSIQYSCEDYEFYIVIGRQRARFTYKDTALFVFSFNSATNSFHLNNNTLLKVDDVNFIISQDSKALYVCFYYYEHLLKAKMTRACYQSIVSFISTEDTLCFNGTRKNITYF